MTFILKGTGEGFSFATFGLWAALGWITAGTMYKGGSNPLIAVVYGTGATATMIALLYKGRYDWSQQDTFVAILVLVCVVLWKTLGSRPAFLASVASGAIAAIPFILLTWKSPGSSPIISNSGFLLANLFTFFGATTWKLEDRLYTGVSALACLALVLPWLLFR